MRTSTTTHPAALKALRSLLAAVGPLESRLASLGEAGVFDYDHDRGAAIRLDLQRACHAMARAGQVLEDTAAVSAADRYTAAKQAKQAAKEALKKQA